MIFSVSFLGTSQAQVWRGYRQNPRIEARLKNRLVFLLNTIETYLGLTLVVSFQTQGLGSGLDLCSHRNREPGTGAGDGEGWMLFSAGDSLQRDSKEEYPWWRHLLPYPEQQGKGET